LKIIALILVIPLVTFLFGRAFAATLHWRVVAPLATFGTLATMNDLDLP